MMFNCLFFLIILLFSSVVARFFFKCHYKIGKMILFIFIFIFLTSVPSMTEYPIKYNSVSGLAAMGATLINIMLFVFYFLIIYFSEQYHFGCFPVGCNKTDLFRCPQSNVPRYAPRGFKKCYVNRNFHILLGSLPYILR